MPQKYRWGFVLLAFLLGLIAQKILLGGHIKHLIRTVNRPGDGNRSKSIPMYRKFTPASNTDNINSKPVEAENTDTTMKAVKIQNLWESQRERKIFNEIQKKRKERVDRVCKKYGLVGKQRNISMFSMVADVNDKFLFCSNYKVASSNWKRVFAYVNANRTSREIEDYIEKKNHSRDITPGRIFHGAGVQLANARHIGLQPGIQERLNHKAFTFTCVRNPFERLASAWRDKFALIDSKNKSFRRTLGVAMIKNFRPNASKEALETGDGVTFYEFLQLVLLYGKTHHYDLHWTPYYANCRFCQIKYDVITHLENISYEAPFVLHRIAGNRTISKEAIGQFPPRNLGPSISLLNSTKLKSTDLYRIIPKLVLNGIRKLYAIDFEMFGYNKYLPFEKEYKTTATLA